MQAKHEQSTACRVCDFDHAAPFQEVEGKKYWRCPECRAIFLDAAQLPERGYELSRYELHENDPKDSRYREFLSRLAGPLQEVLPPCQRGLDYGCGPGPALAEMMREAGHEVELYDPFFSPEVGVLSGLFDFITCTEVAEHFHRPLEEFARLDGLLRVGGWLAVMTCFQTDDAAFAQWHYRRDPTHVTFYREETFNVLAHRFGWRCILPRKDVALLQKMG